MASKSRVYSRDSLGKFAKAVKGRRATRGLGRRAGRGGRASNAIAAGGTLGGVPASKAAARAKTSAAEDVVDGVKIKK